MFTFRELISRHNLPLPFFYSSSSYSEDEGTVTDLCRYNYIYNIDLEPNTFPGDIYLDSTGIYVLPEHPYSTLSMRYWYSNRIVDQVVLPFHEWEGSEEDYSNFSSQELLLEYPEGIVEDCYFVLQAFPYRVNLDLTPIDLMDFHNSLWDKISSELPSNSPRCVITHMTQVFEGVGFEPYPPLPQGINGDTADLIQINDIDDPSCFHLQHVSAVYGDRRSSLRISS